jgi:UDP-N-acetylglucosamine--N-acetylmuramyl-(pentapeptide) pyrophosphoryl-undecaprenol N-acetylglucosamine transferase
MTKKPLTVVFAGGGTGGHVFPAIAIAQAVAQLHPEARIHFIGSKRKMESQAAPKYGFEFHPIWIAGFKRAFSFETLLLPVKIIVSLFQSFLLLRRLSPDVVIGTGGYVSGPPVYVAAKLGYRTLIQEQNETPGATTALLAKLADCVVVTFASTEKYLIGAKRILHKGNPVRLNLDRSSASQARASFGLRDDVKTVFVFGGSQGAASLNNAVRAIAPHLVREGYQLIWQTGPNEFEKLKSLGAVYPGQVVVRPFIDEMQLAYSAATVVVCRAGATSIAEITALGLPSILVPYPHAANDHQYKNARALYDAGASLLIEDKHLGSLESELLGLLSNNGRLQQMSSASKASGKPHAAFEIAQEALVLARRNMEKESGQ